MSNNNQNEFFSGDSFYLVDKYDNYNPLEGWTLKYVFVSGSDRNEFNTTIDDKSFILSLSSEQTQKIKANSYNLIAVFTNTLTNARQTEIIKQIKVKSNIADGNCFDNRVWAEIAIENVKAVLQKKATLEQKKYVINDRSLERHSLKELQDLYNFLLKEIAREKRDGLGGSGRNGDVIFARIVSY